MTLRRPLLSSEPETIAYQWFGYSLYFFYCGTWDGDNNIIYNVVFYYLIKFQNLFPWHQPIVLLFLVFYEKLLVHTFMT